VDGLGLEAPARRGLRHADAGDGQNYYGNGDDHVAETMHSLNVVGCMGLAATAFAGQSPLQVQP